MSLCTYLEVKIQMLQNLMKYFENRIFVYANGKRIFTIHKLPMICLLIKVFWNSDRCGFTVFSDNLTLIFSCETQTIYCMWFHYDTACYSIQFEIGQYVISWIIIFWILMPSSNLKYWLIRIQISIYRSKTTLVLDFEKIDKDP